MGTGGEVRGGGAARAALVSLREAFYGCLSGWADALFELSDAALYAPAPVGSLPCLSLEPVFRRGHGSLYKALARGRIDSERLQRTLVAHRPASWPAVFAVDASCWPRRDAETSPERGFSYSASQHSAGQPMVAGWSYQWIAQVDWAPDSLTAPLDARRIAPSEDHLTVSIAQVQRLVGRLPTDGPLPLFIFDAGYDPSALAAGLAGTSAPVVVRPRFDRDEWTCQVARALARDPQRTSAWSRPEGRATRHRPTM
ncbi:MAG: transposase [Actinobacteria bacterium]|nr:transposase [Actinomycetota bacterium]